MPAHRFLIVIVAFAALLQPGPRELPHNLTVRSSSTAVVSSLPRLVGDTLGFSLSDESGQDMRLTVFLRTEGFGSIQKKRLYVRTTFRDGIEREDLVIDPMEQAAWLPISESSFAAADLISFDAVRNSDRSILIAASYGGGSGDLNWNDQPCGRNPATGEKQNGFRVMTVGEYRVSSKSAGAFTELLGVSDLDEAIYSNCPCYGEWLPSGNIRLERKSTDPEGTFTLVDPAALHFELSRRDCLQTPERRELRFPHVGTERSLIPLEQGRPVAPARVSERLFGG